MSGSRRSPRTSPGRGARTVCRVLGGLALVALALAAAPASAQGAAPTQEGAPGGSPGEAPAQDAEPGQDAPVVRLARATWDTGWFQHEVTKLLLERIGYRVEGPVTMENDEFFRAVGAADVDLWVDGWFPLHGPLLDANPGAEAVGNLVEGGALQGYLVDAATAAEHDLSNLGDLADPDVAELFDADGNGRADLIGCNPGWTCAEIIDHQLKDYGLTGTVEQVQGDYSPLMGDTVDRYEAGEPVLFYTFTPNWTVGLLEPGTDVVWLETPFPSLPADQAGAEGQTAVDGLAGCAADPCQMGWPPSDIRAVANTAFLDANPTVRALLESVEIPLEDILEQNARMVDGEGDIADIRRHAEEWVATNAGTVSDWVTAADPDATPVTEPGGADGGQEGVLRVAVRALPPFVLYEDRAYSGFSVDLVELLAARMGMDTEIYAVDTVAKQIDDVHRGAADVAAGGIAITRGRATDVDFTHPVLHTGLTVLVPTDDATGIVGRVAGFARSLLASDLPWLLGIFAVAVLLTAHLIWWLERHRNPDFAPSYPRGVWDSFYWAVVTMSTVGYGDKTPKGNAARAFALVWIGMGTLLFATVTAAIASTMAVDELRGRIAGPTDLAGHRVAAVAGTAGAAYLSSQGIGPVLVDEIGEAYPLLADGDVDAIVYDAPVLRYHAARDGGGAVRTVGPVFEQVTYGIAVAAGDADRRKEINLALLELLESGVYQQLQERWFGTEDGPG